MQHDDPTRNATLVARLQIEMRILSDIARRVEYAVIDELMPELDGSSQADIQLLDLLIQSADSLETVLGRLADAMSSNSTAMAEDLVVGLPLRDMATRLSGSKSQKQVATSTHSKSTIDLF